MNNRERFYGISDAEYDRRLNEQDGLCAICGKPETARGRSGQIKPLGVDHDHLTGAIRGLLCHACNTVLGWVERLRDDPALHLACVRYLAASWGAEERPELISDEATSLFAADAEAQGIPMRAYADRYGIVYGWLTKRLDLASRGRRFG